MNKIRIGIAGYGNLGKGVELAIRQNKDMELAGIFTRRNPDSVEPLTPGTPVYKLDEAENMKDNIDVMILCGGSATDLPHQTPALAASFNVIDSFDTHAKIPEHFEAVDAAAKENNTTAMISVGWDPGMFSLNRLYGNVILPEGKDYTFWGKGVSQGHSDAIRRIEGVKDAKENGTTAMISVGWDPGMFSLNRLYGNVILPEGKDYTFWGKGVSQGHSDTFPPESIIFSFR